VSTNILRKAQTNADHDPTLLRWKCTMDINHSKGGNLHVIEVRPRQDSIRERFNLAKPFPTCGKPVATVEENSGIIGKLRGGGTNE